MACKELPWRARSCHGVQGVAMACKELPWRARSCHGVQVLTRAQIFQQDLNRIAQPQMEVIYRARLGSGSRGGLLPTTSHKPFPIVGLAIAIFSHCQR